MLTRFCPFDSLAFLQRLLASATKSFSNLYKRAYIVITQKKKKILLYGSGVSFCEAWIILCLESLVCRLVIFLLHGYIVNIFTVREKSQVRE